MQVERKLDVRLWILDIRWVKLKMSGFKELKVYQKSYKAARAVYLMTENNAKEEKYGITGQIRRASLSIPLNIAEGYAKKESQNEFKRYLLIAIGSVNEVLVLIDFSKDIGYLSEEKHQKAYKEYEEIAKMLNSFIKTLNL